MQSIGPVLNPFFTFLYHENILLFVALDIFIGICYVIIYLINKVKSLITNITNNKCFPLNYFQLKHVILTHVFVGPLSPGAALIVKSCDTNFSANIIFITVEIFTIPLWRLLESGP